MQITELAECAGVSSKTIRYYESIDLLPPPQRDANNYRRYGDGDVERLQFIASARRLGLSLADIAAFLALRDQQVPPCAAVLMTLDHHIAVIDRQVADLLSLRAALVQIGEHGAQLPQDDLTGERCVCALIKSYESGGRGLATPLV
jgi:MerR family transcriptional regulator, copper efflux regulator